jgi:phosphoglycerate dehydrogenase-like enzyme
MAPRLVVPDDYNDVYGSSEQFSTLQNRCEIEIFTTPFKSVDEVVERIGDAEIIVANRERTPLHADVLARLPSLRLIAQTGMRGAHLDVDAATERGILVAGATGSKGFPSAGFNAASTVELTVGLMIAASRRIPQGHNLLHAGRWDSFVGRELAGRKLGILGLGRIGTRVATICQAIGMDVLAWGPTLTPERAAASGVTYRPLDDLLREVDVLSVHLRLSPESRGLISREKLALMKPSALLVNTSRGPIVDEDALLEALRAGRLWGAALDVFWEEPLPADYPILKLENVVVTPHVGWVAEDSYGGFIEGVVENVNAYLDGQQIPRMLNPEALERRRTS